MKKALTYFLWHEFFDLNIGGIRVRFYDHVINHLDRTARMEERKKERKKNGTVKFGRKLLGRTHHLMFA